MIGTTLPTPLYVLYRARFGFSELMVTVIFATYAVGVIAALLLFGRLSDQIGRRRVLLPGLAFSVLSTAAFLAAQGLGLLLVGRLLSGLSAGIFTGTATATLIDFALPMGGRATAVHLLGPPGPARPGGDRGMGDAGTGRGPRPPAAEATGAGCAPAGAGNLHPGRRWPCW